MKSTLLLARPRAALWSLAAVAVLLLAVAAAAEKAATESEAPVADNSAAVSSQRPEEGSAASAAPAPVTTQATHHEAGATGSAGTGRAGATVSGSTVQPGATVPARTFERGATGSASTGQPGASVTFSTNGPAATPGESHSSSAPRVIVFALKYAEAAGAAETIEALYGAGREPSLTVAVDQRTNALIVRGSPEALELIEDLLKRLDAEQPATGNAARKAADLRAGMDARLSIADPTAMPSPNPAMAGRIQQYRDLDRQASRLAADLRNVQQNKSGRRAPEATRSLRQAVEAAFEARQELQRAQLADLRQRLTRIEASIDTRQRNKDAIVEHRVKELLDPNLQWTPEGEPLAGPGTPAQSLPTPPGMGNWPALAPGQNVGDSSALRPQPVIATEPAAGTRGPVGPGVADGMRVLDSPRAFQKELAEAVGELRQAEDQVNRALDDLRIKSTSARVEDVTPMLLNMRDAAKKRVDFLRKEYDAQVQLLELDLNQGMQEYRAAEDALKRAKQLFDRGVAPQSELAAQESAIRSAQIRVEQLQTILKLYEMIPDARPEPPKSEATPEPKKPEATAPGTAKPEPPKPEPMDPSASGPPKPNND